MDIHRRSPRKRMTQPNHRCTELRLIRGVLRELARHATWIVAALTVWASVSAHAASAEEDFREQYLRAGKLYAAGDYQAAIPALLSAYAIQPAPQLLFNIGQAYRRLQIWSSARVYFELYRTLAPDIAPAALAELQELILSAKEREEEERKPEIREKTRTVVIQEEKPLPRWLRPLGIVGGIAGLGLGISGAVLLSLDGQCAGATPAPIVECPQVYSSRTPGVALAASGAGLLLAGAISFGLSLRKPTRPQKRTVDDERLDVPLLVPAQRPQTEPPPSGWDPDGSPSEPPPAGYSPNGQPQ